MGKELFASNKRRRAVKASQETKKMIERLDDEDEVMDMDLDLTSGGWCRRRSESIPIDGGFSRFPKTVQQWETEKVIHNAENELTTVETEKVSHNAENEFTTVNGEIQDSDTSVADPSSSMEYPWREVDIFTYPEKWRDLSFYQSSFMINEACLKTLLPGELIEDNIVNLFLRLGIQENANDQWLIFDSQFFVTLLDDTDRFGFVRWAQKVEAWKYNIWLMPECEGKHWTLMVIVFSSQTIVYLDSLHGTPHKQLMSRLCGFMEKIFGKRDLPQYEWRYWTLFCPLDVPSQVPGFGGGNNCGAHLCTWAYIICSSQVIFFTEKIMLKVRKWIFDKIVASKGKSTTDPVKYSDIKKLDPRKTKSKISKYITLSRAVPGNSTSTVEYCACLKFLFLYK